MSKEKEAMKMALEYVFGQLTGCFYAKAPTAQQVYRALEEALAKQDQGEPLDTPLPCDVKVGHVNIRKGVALRVLVARMQVLYDMAQPKQEQGEPVAWPEPMEQPPLYANEDPAEQARAFRYRAGWNDCLEKCKAATTPPQRKPLTPE